MPTLLQDLRYAARAFRKTPGFTAAAVLSVGIGIGANTAIFSVTHALLIEPLPYPDSDRLAILWNRSPGLDIAEDWFSTAQYFDIKTRHSGLEDVAIAHGMYRTLTGDDGEPERVGTIRLSTNLLTMLGARAAHGRLLLPDDDVPGAAGVAVIGHGTWMRRYGGDPSVVGRSVSLDGQPVEIVGVLAPGFAMPREVLPTLGVVEEGDFVLPIRLGPNAATVRTREDFNVLARLAPGVTFEAAQAEMDTITASLRSEFPDVYPPNGGLTFSLVPLQEQVVGGVRTALVVLSGAVGFVLLIACANVANLLLSRALGRQREMAVRAALGASRGRLVRQLFSESVLLAFAGGAAGILLALAGVRWLHLLQPEDVPRLGAIGIDGGVLLFTCGVSALSGLLFGLAPALGLSKVDVQSHLQDAGRGSSASGALWGRGDGLRRLLVVAELALSVVLLIGAGLLIRSFAHVQQVPGGFTPDGVLTFELSLMGQKYPDSPAVQRGYKALWERLDALPGVTSSGGVIPLPLSNFFAWGPIQVEGRTPPAGERFINADQRVATSRYFETLGIPLLEGRYFTDEDLPGMTRVVIVDERMANDLWPGQSAIGKRIRYGDQTTTTEWETVVGVVGQVKQYALDADARIAFYRPHTQQPARQLYVTVRAAGDAAALGGPVRDAIRALDPDLPIFRMKTMEARVDESLARRRFLVTLLSLFAAVAAALAAIGIYGVMAYLVSQGTREMGIRIALGASPASIERLVIRQGLILGLAGVTAGLAGAFALTQLLESLLFGVEPTDPVTFAAIAAALFSVAAAASYIPARRAARTDPIVALRSE